MPFFIQLWSVRNGVGFLSTEMKTKPTERGQLSCMCVYTWQPVCFANVVECLFDY